MGRYASDTGGDDFIQPSPGPKLARSFRIIDIGTHRGEYQGKPTKRNQFILQWELPEETTEFDGKQQPLIVSKFYTNSLSKKSNLRKDLESWRSRGFTAEELMKFDLINILNKPCILTLIHNENGRAVVKAISPLMKGMECPPAVNKIEAFWLDEWDDNKFMSLSEGFKKLIVESEEYNKFGGPAEYGHGQSRSTVSVPRKAEGIDDSDIPFN